MGTELGGCVGGTGGRGNVEMSEISVILWEIVGDCVRYDMIVCHSRLVPLKVYICVCVCMYKKLSNVIYNIYFPPLVDLSNIVWLE